jgi:hypothetical protein
MNPGAGDRARERIMQRKDQAMFFSGKIIVLTCFY